VAVLELPPEDGEHIGRYRVVRLLARGGMGEVLLAWDPHLNRSVAIKRIRHDSDTPILRQRLLQEAYAVGSLHHPAIVTVYDLPEHEGDDCIVMEYVPGQTLAEALKRGPLEPALAVHLAKRVASGLAAAHEAGFIHRDLKTENVMVTPTEEAKILDFGVAKPMGITADDPSLTMAGSVVGTCRAMSPEQARGAEVDERSDLFSLGVLLYETLTGISPFQGSNAPETLNKVISERPPCVDTLRPGLPPRLVALLVRLLAKEPDGRPQSAAEVVRELEAIAAAQGPAGDPEETVSVLPTDAVKRWRGDATPAISPPVAMPTPPLEEPFPPSRRRRLMVPILSSLVVLAGVIGFIAFPPKKPDEVAKAAIRTKLLWVVVLGPQQAGHDAQFQRAASALVKASLKTLGYLKGIVPIGPVMDLSKDGTGIARAAAEDALTVALEQPGNRGIIKLSRIRGRDARVLWSSTFTAPIDTQNLQGVEEEIAARIPFAYHLRPPRTDVSKNDYAAFFEIKQRIDEGQVASESDLSKLEKMVTDFPHFLEAQLLEADVMVMLSSQNHDKAYSERALQLVQGAKASFPGDTRPLQSEFQIELIGPQWQDASKTLARLINLEPGNPQIPALQASLDEKQGKLGDALTAWRQAVDYVPSWWNLLRLAKIEEELGLAEGARNHLEQILEVSPDSTYALRRLAELELDYGDPAKAETIYGNLLKISPTSDDYINLGTARVLRQHYADAIIAFNQALEIKPRDAAATLNLADAELALGHQETSTALYKTVCPQWETGHPLSGTTADDMIQAQCLAHLGHPQEATMIVRNALRQNPDSPDITLSAALVYTLAGNHDGALELIQNAIAKHGCPNWFKVPAFAPLFKDQRYQKILAGAAH
jgi:serine/threonine protein kinase/tetratricopeptide (TPR) repeat protein